MGRTNHVSHELARVASQVKELDETSTSLFDERLELSVGREPDSMTVRNECKGESDVGLHVTFRTTSSVQALRYQRRRPLTSASDDHHQDVEHGHVELGPSDSAHALFLDIDLLYVLRDFRVVTGQAVVVLDVDDEAARVVVPGVGAETVAREVEGIL